MLIFRAVGQDWKSRLGLATSIGGTRFDIVPTFLLGPSGPLDCEGVEDPRLTKVDDQLVLTYTAFDGRCARQSLAYGRSLWSLRSAGAILPHWHRTSPRGALACGWTKAGSLFPSRIAGKYGMLFGDEQINMAVAEEMRGPWKVIDQPILQPRPGMFDGGYIEMGPPPIHTPYGWLVLYHGVQRRDDVPGDARVYRLAAALLESAAPQRVIWRCQHPILEPIRNERIGLLDIAASRHGPRGLGEVAASEVEQRQSHGILPSAVFCCGALWKGDHVWIYYATGDEVLNLAIVQLRDILTL